MSSVLRKKIEAGAGIPPTILQYQDFWDMLQVKVSAWIFDTYGIEAKAVPDVRKVVPGNVALAQLDALQSLVLNARFSPGLCAVGVDPAGAAMNAGVRLAQGDDPMQEASALFLKLLFEAPGLVLWRSLAASLDGHIPATGNAPLSDSANAVGGFDPVHRYLMVSYGFSRGETRGRLWLVFDNDYVLARALGAQNQASGRRGASGGRESEALRASVRSSTITVDGVLDRLEMTIGQCSRLEVGQLLSLPEADTGRITLLAETVNGNVAVGIAEMGVWKRQRALKLSTPILEPFTRELSKL
ncbi:MAG TPA: FliM/FliN family flagellar motor switch protein [Hyphomonas sp.]|nr:FliM/FliN family flagellar motor switch protein [Hyphomonas sp.]HRK66051.1 FliM/FliN family flagellar motor switch protein [Hyphomonas sp.]